MAKIGVLLLGLLLLCSLLLVTSEHRARKMFIDLQRTQAQTRQLEIAWNRLVLEQTQLAKHSLIDPVARRELKMQPVTPDRTLYLSPSARMEQR